MDSKTPVHNPESSQPKVPSGSILEQQARLPRALAIAAIILLVAGVTYGIFATLKPQTKTNPNSKAALAIDPAQVSITSSGFRPSTVTIKANQGVVWTNQDTAPHQIASDPYPVNNALSNLNDPQSLSHNETFSYLFDSAGTYTYHDNLNPTVYKGTIKVVK